MASSAVLLNESKEVFVSIARTMMDMKFCPRVCTFLIEKWTFRVPPFVQEVFLLKKTCNHFTNEFLSFPYRSIGIIFPVFNYSSCEVDHRFPYLLEGFCGNI